MKSNQKLKATTILVSVHRLCYDGFNEESQTSTYSFREVIYEACVQNIGDMAILFHKFGKRAKYKKSTDKNWYTYRTMMNRLFKKEIAEKENEPQIVGIGGIVGISWEIEGDINTVATMPDF